MRTTIQKNRFLKQREAAARYGLHVSTLIKARKRGELRAVKFGRAVRYSESELARWVNANTEAGDR